MSKKFEKKKSDSRSISDVGVEWEKERIKARIMMS